MKRLSKILAVLLILSVIPVSAATYTLVTANYPILVNGQNTGIQAYNLNGTTLLPVRQVSEAVGVPIKWTGQVEINTVDVDKLKEACVMIDAQSSTKASQGSAVAWDYGEYLTANHVVADGRTSIVSDVDFKVDKTNAQLDIATLATDEDTKPVKIGDSDEVRVGDSVILISSPNWKENTVTWYEVEINSTQIVLSGTAIGGASAVFNTQGELIGILTSSNNAVKDCYVIPINAIRKAF